MSSEQFCRDYTLCYVVFIYVTLVVLLTLTPCILPWNDKRK